MSMKEVMAMNAVMTNTHRKFHQRLKEFCEDRFKMRPHTLCKGGKEVRNCIHEDLVVSTIVVIITFIF